ncbi:MAG: aminotransferase class I/II-fold pyridoxal phosphate-dependent enzyme [Thermonemataceae bacterium]
MDTLTARMQRRLDEREKVGNLRTLQVVEGHIDFASNDYLGLARNQELQRLVEKRVSQIQGYQLGATGSRLISGTHPYTLDLERKLASLFRGEAALLFNSGYQANTALLATVPQKGDTILCDELIHASWREGARLSFARKYYFKHNDLSDLAQKLAQAQGEVFVVIEAVYSMDGDFGEIAAISKLCEQYQAKLIVDEAHSTGIFGDNGNGYLNSLSLKYTAWATVYTFGKAIGTHGACIVGSTLLKDYLVNFARAFIYTTALPLHSLVNIEAAFDFITQHPSLIEILREKISYFKAHFNHPLFSLKESHTPIQILKVGGNQTTKQLAQVLQKQCFAIKAILAPTVREGEEIIRICLHTFNSNEEIYQLIQTINTEKLEVTNSPLPPHG